MWRILLALSGIVAATVAGGLIGRPWQADTHPARALAAGTSLSLTGCIEVSAGDTFTIDFVVQDVTDLLAWELYFAYDRKLVEVTGKDVRLLLSANPNSNVFDFSDPLPNSAGLYRFGAADTGGQGSSESGSGVLGRLTLKAKEKGLTYATIYRDDVDHNGSIDIGPTLARTGGQYIEDDNGDGYFDGLITSGQIAIDRSCSDPPPTPRPGDVLYIPTPPARGPTPEPTTGPGQPADGASPKPGETPAGASSGEPSPSGETSPEESGDAAGSSHTPRGTSPTATSFLVNPPHQGGSGGSGFSSWLIGLIAGSLGAGGMLTYFIYKTSRRAV